MWTIILCWQLYYTSCFFSVVTYLKTFVELYESCYFVIICLHYNLHFAKVIVYICFNIKCDLRKTIALSEDSNNICIFFHGFIKFVIIQIHG